MGFYTRQAEKVARDSMSSFSFRVRCRAGIQRDVLLSPHESGRGKKIYVASNMIYYVYTDVDLMASSSLDKRELPYFDRGCTVRTVDGEK